MHTRVNRHETELTLLPAELRDLDFDLRGVDPRDLIVAYAATLASWPAKYGGYFHLRLNEMLRAQKGTANLLVVATDLLDAVARLCAPGSTGLEDYERNGPGYETSGVLRMVAWATWYAGVASMKPLPEAAPPSP